MIGKLMEFCFNSSSTAAAVLSGYGAHVAGVLYDGYGGGCSRGSNTATISRIVLCVVVVMAGMVLAMAAVGGMKTRPRERGRSRRPPLPPGPRPWPIVGNLLQVGAVPHHGMRRLMAKYGPLVYLRLGAIPAVVTDDPALVREFLRRQDHVFASRPANLASRHFTYGGQDIAFAPYGPHWRAVRRLCLFELLTPRRLEYFRQGRRQEAGCLLADVLAAARAGRAVDLRDVFGALSSNTLTRMILGKRFFGPGATTAAQAAEHKALIYQGFALTNAFNVADYLPFLRPFDPQGRQRAMRAVMRRVDQIYDAIIAEHSAKRASPRGEGDAADHGQDDDAHVDVHTNFVDQLLSLPGEDGEPHLKHTTIKAILIDLVAAGTDTSSITSEWTMAELLKHPKIMEKVVTELDNVVGKDRVVEEDDLPHLNYLKAVVKEIFRIHPVGAFLIPHVSMEDTVVAGYHIPKNTRVLINTYSLGLNEKVWERVQEFWPERFLNGNMVEFNDGELKIVPFGAGRRGCPGATLGSIVVLLGLARLIQAFNWSPTGTLQDHSILSSCPNYYHNKGHQDIDLTMAHGLMVLASPLKAYPTPRLAPHLYEGC